MVRNLVKNLQQATLCCQMQFLDTKPMTQIREFAPYCFETNLSPSLFKLQTFETDMVTFSVCS